MNDSADTYQGHFLRRIWKNVSRIWKPDINVYFVSGMCYNCSVFDKLELPQGFRKAYIEWIIPNRYETIGEYSRKMARRINTRHPFVLVGYSFGGVIVQEMSKFLSPRKIILISSYKSKKEIPALFRFARATNIIEKAPETVFSSTGFVTSVFNKIVYDMPNVELAKYMTVVDPAYIRWAARQIVNWVPEGLRNTRLYHIQGTKDQIFSYDKMDDVYPVSGGDHLMVLKHAAEVSRILAMILTKKE